MFCYVIFPQFRETSTAVAMYTFLGISSVVLALLTVVGNLLILCAIRKCQTLHAPTKALLCNLAFSDLGVGIVVYPLFAAHWFAVVLNNIRAFCAVLDPYVIAAYIMGSVSLYTMTAISLDKYYAFTLRLRYHRIVTFKRVVLAMGGCWIVGFTMPFLWLLSETGTRILGAVLIFFCIVMTSICYIKVIIGIRRHQRQIQELKATSASQHHGGSLLRIGRYKRSLNTMILLFWLQIACYLPFFIAAAATMGIGANSNKMLALNITKAFIYFKSLLNPLAYCLRMREIRRQVLTSLSCFVRFMRCKGVI
ncbi:melanocyte-stimulating hormone receptor-like [Orbicella faveolata]|uniref:melanocyte-stimulating hormone receptor-like n=1 Tax=Orbicella faveolata TaxID=48498 RepID=UPI0009E585DB|nr:melanocyte-stimulating hormone receptor-like [Orbicella faveolata]